MPFASARFRLRPLCRNLLLLGLATQPGLVLAESTTMLDAVVVSASQTEHSELSAPASVSVITRAELEQLQVQNVTEAIRALPGIHIAPATSYGRQEIKIRGLDSDYSLLLVNGRRINSRDALTSGYGNDFDLAAIPLAAVERIEVIRGPMSSLYGADALGGVVNLILRRPTTDTEAGLDYSLDSLTDGHGGDSHLASGYVSGALLEDKLLANLILSGTHTDAWRTEQTLNPNADAIEQREKLALLSTLTWLVDERQELDLDLSYNRDDREAHWNNYGIATPTNIQQMDRLALGLTHSGHWDGLESRLRYYFEEVELYDDAELMTQLRGRAGDVNQRNHTLDGQLSGELGTHLLTAGAEYRLTRLQHNLNLQGGDVSVEQHAVYLQDEFSIGALDLTLSGRLDHHEGFGSEFSPRAYALYNLSDNWVLKGGVGKAFKAPSIAQSDAGYGVSACRGMCTVVGNPELQPETALSYEVGTLYQADAWGAGLTVFHNEIDDMIVSEQWGPGFRPPVMSYHNISQARVQGLELNGWVDLGDSLSLTGNYTLVDAEDRDTGLELVQTPEHTANLRLDWRPLDKLGTYLGYHYTGSQLLYVPARGRNAKSDAYHTLDLGTNYQATEALTLKVGLNNLTNTKRDQVATEVDNILKGRSIFAGFSYRL